MSTHDDYAARAGYQLDNPGGAELVVALHGLGANHRQPLDLLAELPRTGVAVLAPDTRAHGGTGVIGEQPDFRFPALVADLTALVRRLGQAGKPTHLVGISMGAAIALRAALSNAFPIRSLALIRPAFGAVPLPPNLVVMARIGDALRQARPDLARAEFARSPDYRAVAAVSGLAAASLLGQFDAPAARERSIRLRSVPHNIAYDDARELSGVQVPTLVIGTDRDPVHPVELALTWSRAIPAATLAMIPPRDDDEHLSAARARDLVARHLCSQLAPSPA